VNSLKNLRIEMAPAEMAPAEMEPEEMEPEDLEEKVDKGGPLEMEGGKEEDHIKKGTI
jgi:hypothetical protein